MKALPHNFRQTDLFELLSFSSSITRLNTEPETLDAALKRVDANADTAWKKAALEAVHHLCRTQTELTTDDVWAALEDVDASTHEPRALGAIIQQSAKRGWCRNTMQFVRSERPECHRRPIPLWQSLIFSPHFR